MVFAVAGGNQLDTGYTIDNSVMLNDGGSGDYLTRTPASAGNRKTWTWSAWVKRSTLTTNINPLFECFLNANQWTALSFGTNNKLRFYHVDSGTDYGYETDMVFRDVSAWYHIVVALDTTQATAANRMILYINGSEVTFDQNYGEFPQNDNTWINSTNQHAIGLYSDQSKYFDGYIAECNFIDGQQLAASDFGEYDADSGIWKPIEYTGSYGTNGFYLDFTNGGTSLGTDASGNGNNFTTVNLNSLSQKTDTPTNNFATLNSQWRARIADNGTYAEGNTQVDYTSSGRGMSFSSHGVTSGKWYWEVKFYTVTRATAGVAYDTVSRFGTPFYDYNPSDGFGIYGPSGDVNYSATYSAYTSGGYSNGDIMMVALDMDNHLCWFGKNGTWSNSATQAEIEAGTATNDATTVMGTQQYLNSGAQVFPFVACLSSTGVAEMSVNFGNPSFSITSGNSDGNGYGNFEYTVPSGFYALCTKNLAQELTIPIDDSSQYFNTKLYSGNSTTNPITGVGFAPDFTWLKARNYANAHFLLDTTRGSGQVLFSSSNIGEVDYQGTRWQSFDSDGFTLTGSDSSTNISGGNYVTWNWKANGGTTSSNTDGSITSTVQANTAAGFSIVTYTGNQTNGATVGHGLGIAPKLVMVKERNGTSGWIVKHTSLPDAGYYLILNADDARSTVANVWNDTDPSSTVFTLGDNTSVNENTLNYVAYCFAEIEGYSKFGKYTGNGSSDGPFVNCGFKPAFVLYKDTEAATDWRMLDATRDTYNPANKRLFPNSSSAENTGYSAVLDLNSNGFKLVGSHTTGFNTSGNDYVFMAFAENPFATSTGVAGTAR